MVETRWGRGVIIFIFGILGCQGHPFHPVSSALSSSSETKASPSSPSADPASGDSSLYKYYSADPSLSPEELQNYFSHNPDGSPLYSGEFDEISSDADKRGRNFLRFGRGPNFLRFGRGGPMEFGLGNIDPTDEDVKRARNFLRFGRGFNKNYLRFGRAYDRNYLRFGRSTDSQKGELEASKLDDKTPNSYHVNTQINPDEIIGTPNILPNKNLRSKRSTPSYYSDLWSAPPTSLTWDTNLADFVAGHQSQEGLNEAMNHPAKRAQHRSFFRYGRDPLDLHFLRFGKRSPEMDGDDDSIVHLFPRGINKNFLRFG